MSERSARTAVDGLDGPSISRQRKELVASADLAGPTLAERLARQADGWFQRLGASLPPGWELMATGGYARSALCPGSDLDVILLHPRKVSDAGVRDVAESIWYPLWDSGIKLSPAAHTTKSLLALAADDIVTATSLLTVRALAGDGTMVHQVREGGLAQWRVQPKRWLRRLRELSEERWSRAGEVSSLLEPDLKEGRGGLRDRDVLNWAVATDLPDVEWCLEGDLEDLSAPAQLLLSARYELHRVTGRMSNVLLLQDQDAVADSMGLADADVLMRQLSGAARTIDWASGRFWWRIDTLLPGGVLSGRGGSGRGVSGRGNLARGSSAGTVLGRGRRPRPVPVPVRGVHIVDDEIDVTSEADFSDQSFVFRVAATASRLGVPLSRHCLITMATNVTGPVEDWTERTRQAFVSLLGSGDSMVATIEALEHHDLFSLFLPEWRHVRSLPQRNAFHTYNVDRHLLRTVVNATRFLRDVARPDLLLVGALLHDIGKGYPGDHTEVGMELVEGIVPRMGFPADDLRIVRVLVEHHLLLPETATRRDLADPRTASNVAAAVGDLAELQLLRALTEADSLATGPAAWSSWKEALVDALTESVAEKLRGRTVTPATVDIEVRFEAMLEQIRMGGGVWAEHQRVGEFDLFTVATADQPGLFAKVAGTLALHRVDVFGAEAWTSTDGIAIEQFQILPNATDPAPFGRVQRDLTDFIAGRLDVDSRLESRVRSSLKVYRRAVAAAPPATEVLISNDASDSTTMIDVRVPDAPAVLYKLSAALASYGVNIRSAKVATLGHEVVDVFYVQAAGDDARQLDDHEREELRELLRTVTTSPSP